MKSGVFKMLDVHMDYKLRKTGLKKNPKKTGYTSAAIFMHQQWGKKINLMGVIIVKRFVTILLPLYLRIIWRLAPCSIIRDYIFSDGLQDHPLTIPEARLAHQINYSKENHQNFTQVP